MSAALRGTAATDDFPSPMRRADMAWTPDDIPCSAAWHWKLSVLLMPTAATHAVPSRPTMALSARFSTFWLAIPPMTGSACLATISTLSCDTPRMPLVTPMDRRNLDLGSGAMSVRVASSLGAGVPTSSSEVGSASDDDAPPMGMDADPTRRRSLRWPVIETRVVRAPAHRSRRPPGARASTSRRVEI